MFEKLLRSTLLKNLSKDEQETAMLLKEKVRIGFIVESFLVIFLILIFALSFWLMEQSENNVYGDDLSLFYVLITFLLVRRFFRIIKFLKKIISNNLYSSRYTINGNAILKSDFETIKKKDKELYSLIMHQQCQGYCYAVCFNLLKCLKKGVIQFVAVRNIQLNKQDNTSMYTMHVLYVNNSWCFDTYSQRQYPLDECIKKFNAKTYKCFSIEDIKGKTFKEFKKEYAPELKVWCEENDCYQKFG